MKVCHTTYLASNYPTLVPRPSTWQCLAHMVGFQAPLSSLEPRLQSPASFPGCNLQPRSQAAISSLVPRLQSPASFPGCTLQPRSQAALSSLIPRLHSPALISGCTLQPRSQAPLSSLVPSLHSPASFPDSTLQPRSHAPLPSLIPRLHSPASFPDSTLQPRSQIPLSSLIPRLHSPAFLKRSNITNSLPSHSGFQRSCKHPVTEVPTLSTNQVAELDYESRYVYNLVTDLLFSVSTTCPLPSFFRTLSQELQE